MRLQVLPLPLLTLLCALTPCSVFNFDEHGDEMFGSQHSTSADKPTDGKLEKSFLNFQQSYPNLAPSASAQPFLRRFDAFKGIKYATVAMQFLC